AIGAGEPGGAAEVNACRLLKKAKILERVHELQAQAAEDIKETAEKCVQELNQLEKTLTATKPIAQQWPQLWEKPKSSTSASINTNSAAKSTSAKPAAWKTLGASCFKPLASKNLMMFRSKKRLR